MSKTSDLNKALTEKFFEQVFNQKNYAVARELLGPDYHYNGRKTSADETIGWAQGLQQQFPGLYFTVESILAEDDKVALRWRMNATEPKSGQKGYFSGTNIIIWRDGQALQNDQGGGDKFNPAT